MAGKLVSNATQNKEPHLLIPPNKGLANPLIVDVGPLEQLDKIVEIGLGVESTIHRVP